MVTCIVDCLIPRIIGILIGNLHLVVKSRISSRGWKLCEEPNKGQTSIQKISLMRCILRIVCIEVMTNHQFRHVLWAALRPIWTLRKFWYFLNFLSIYMSLNSRYSFVLHFVCDLWWIVSILFFWHLWILLQMIKLLNWISLCQLTIAGIKYTGMYSPMHSSNKV